MADSSSEFTFLPLPSLSECNRIPGPWDGVPQGHSLRTALLILLLPFETVARLFLKGEGELNRKVFLLGHYLVSDLERGSESLAGPEIFMWAPFYVNTHVFAYQNQAFGFRLVGQLMNSGEQPLGLFSVALVMPTALFSIVSLYLCGFFPPEKKT